MATCPNCGKKLRFIDWRPVCPSCGVNLNYFNANEKLIEESEKAEIEHARFQPKVDRAKASTIGTKTGIVRMVLFLVPILSLLLPLFSVTVSGVKKSINAIGIYNIFSAVDTGKILGNISPIVIAVALLALPVVLAIVFTIMQVTAGTKKGLTRNIVLSCISIALVLGSIICTLNFAGGPADDYAGIILNEAGVAAGKDQKTVDDTVQKLRQLFNDDTIDVSLLEKAIASGEAAAESGASRGYTSEQQEALIKAVDNGKAVLKEKADITQIRDAASEIKSAVSVYPELNTAVKYASEIENDGSYSEQSFDSLTSAIESGKEILDLLDKNEPIVELTKNNGATEKTEEEIKEDTEEKIASATQNINNALASLTDVSVLNVLTEKLNASVEDGSFADDFAPNVKASIGIGEIVFLILLFVQLANNIRIKKKGFEVKYTQCYIGGLPSQEYFEYVEQGKPLYEIREKMVDALTIMQNEVRAKAAEAAAKEQAERAARK